MNNDEKLAKLEELIRQILVYTETYGQVKARIKLFNQVHPELFEDKPYKCFID